MWNCKGEDTERAEEAGELQTIVIVGHISTRMYHEAVWVINSEGEKGEGEGNRRWGGREREERRLSPLETVWSPAGLGSSCKA